jgi:hypothetical protein
LSEPPGEYSIEGIGAVWEDYGSGVARGRKDAERRIRALDSAVACFESAVALHPEERKWKICLAGALRKLGTALIPAGFGARYVLEQVLQLCEELRHSDPKSPIYPWWISQVQEQLRRL